MPIDMAQLPVRELKVGEKIDTRSPALRVRYDGVAFPHQRMMGNESTDA